MSPTAAFHGTLFTESFARTKLSEAFAGRLGESDVRGAQRRLLSWWKAASSVLGPVAGLRAILDRGAVPLLSQLGYRLSGPPSSCGPTLLAAGLDAGAGVPIGLLATSWTADIDQTWRDAVRLGVALNADWCFCFNGHRLRLVDTRRTYARRFVEFDIGVALEDPAAFGVLWAVLRAESLLSASLAEAEASPASISPRCLLDEIADGCTRHQAEVNRSIEEGVRSALITLSSVPLSGPPQRGCRAGDPGGSKARSDLARELVGASFEQSLTLIYRVLFLLYAEARGLVPVWHPVYRDAYAVERLCDDIERGSDSTGSGGAILAICRLAAQGCHARDLVATPFNGRLFDLGRTPLIERILAEDSAVRDAVLALSTRSRASGGPPQRGGRAEDPGAGRERIAYGDLGVEQLGAIYEQVIDCTPHVVEGGRPTVRLEAAGGRRKSTGTFYTPRSVTEYLVRRALHPLVAGASSDAILQLRVLDPAMGSGAFLVAACRYLAAGYEAAIRREQRCGPDDFDDRDRAAFRRLVAQRCLFGVDVNPMAVELAKLSLWLTTLAADEPLTFLDHHLRVGDSLIGASPEDLARQPPGTRSRSPRREHALPLFDLESFHENMRVAVPLFSSLSSIPDNTVAAVRQKERAFAGIRGADSPLSRWRAIAGLWCASWFWPHAGRAPTRALFLSLTDTLLGRPCGLPPTQTRAWLETAHRVAEQRLCFHWTLEFPDAFFDTRGRPLPSGGFNAVLGNPPWDMIRADTGDPHERGQTRLATQQLTRFLRQSGIFHATPTGHLNRYQPFLERILTLTRDGGRLGLVLPSGLATDHGAAHLRRRLLEHCDVDSIIGFDNRRAVFPVHRSVRFLLITATTGQPTRSIRCRFGEHDPEQLDRISDSPNLGDDTAFPVGLSAAFLARISGPRLAIPELRSRMDVLITDKIFAAHRPLGEPDAWGVSFGRELNASEDRHLFKGPEGGVPVIEGKHLVPFRVQLSGIRHRVSSSEVGRRLGAQPTYGRPRLACRDVASAQNRLTLIAAILPARSVTTHTVLCLKTPLEIAPQHFLCAVLNSFVANYLIRQRVTTHVTAAGLECLPVPKPVLPSRQFDEIADLARRLAATAHDETQLADRLQAAVALLYGVSEEEFTHILNTFPLFSDAERQTVLTEFRRQKAADRRSKGSGL